MGVHAEEAAKRRTDLLLEVLALHVVDIQADLERVLDLGLDILDAVAGMTTSREPAVALVVPFVWGGKREAASVISAAAAQPLRAEGTHRERSR